MGGAASIWERNRPAWKYRRVPLPEGSCVIATSDFDPESIQWPKAWGAPLLLKKSIAIQVISDDGGDRAFGHYVGQPEKCGYFLKHLTKAYEIGQAGDSERTTHRAFPTGPIVTDSQLTASQVPKNLPGAKLAFLGRDANPTGPHSEATTTACTPCSPASTVSLFSSPTGNRSRPSPLPDPPRLRTPEVPISQISERSDADWALSRPQEGHSGSRCRATRAASPGLKIGLEGFKPSQDRLGGAPRTQGGHTASERVSREKAISTGQTRHEQKRCPETQLWENSENDFPKDENLAWLAEAALRVELPEGWITFDDDDGQPVYYHEGRRVVTRKHPMLARFKAYAQRLQKFYESLSTKEALKNASKIRAHLGVVLNEVLNRCHRELPPMTPELLERAALLLAIDTASDFALSAKVKIAIESFAEDQYDISVSTGQKADLDGFIKQLRSEQIQLEVLSKQDSIIMCSEFNDLPAAVKCEECMDFFSLEGFQKCHASGTRRKHHPLKVAQCACSVFPWEPATCEVDGQYYSDRGYEKAAQHQPQLQLKPCQLLGGIKCSEYPDRPAEVLCEDCCDFFCIEAFLERHGHGHRQQHTQLQLHGSAVYRFGQPLPAEEASRLLRRAKLAREGGPWLAFRDDHLTTYWYHLRDKVVTFENPYLGNPLCQ